MDWTERNVNWTDGNTLGQAAVGACPSEPALSSSGQARVSPRNRSAFFFVRRFSLMH
jgi:hypothetical protein